MVRQALDKSLRNELERTVSKARAVAEDAAREAVGQLGVSETEAPAHLDGASRDLRNKLRAHARALGDDLAKDGSQAVNALVEEIAYEQWHRMIFARFLAENDLLMFDDGSGTALSISLDEAAELADELGKGSKWDLASECAAKMLPGVFRPDTLSFQIKFASDKIHELEALLDGLAVDTFSASDSLGWIYQFWQRDRKDAVNASEVKIGAKELAPVTQLFTENYMVAFLLDNTLGAWYAAPKLKGKSFATEAEARAAVATDEIPLTYLRLVQEGGEWRPAAGSFEKWPASLAQFSMVDPSSGSGHFLVATMLMLVPMRMELEGLDARTAIDKVLSENIHGLELDRRCVELAAFAVALEAWRYPNAGGWRPLPRLNIACDGIAPQMPKKDWVRLARKAARRLEGKGEDFFGEEFDKDESLWERNLARSMDELWDVFKDAPTLGSLIEPESLLPLFTQAGYDEVVKVLQESVGEDSAEDQEATVAAKGIVAAMGLLKKHYTLVITNVPYLARGKQDDFLQAFCGQFYKDSRGDLATVFLERCLKFASSNGSVSLVIPQNWLFLTSYRKLREKVLRKSTINSLAKLGPGAFESISGEVVNVQLITLTKSVPLPEHYFAGLDISSTRAFAVKVAQLSQSELKLVRQRLQINNPDARISLDDRDAMTLVSKHAVSLQGVSSADLAHYGRMFWETESLSGTDFCFWQTTALTPAYYGGKSLMLWFNDDLKRAFDQGKAFYRGDEAVGRTGIAVAQIGSLLPTLSVGTVFDTNCAMLLPNDDDALLPLWCYCSDPSYKEEVRRIDQKLNVTNATFAKVPFDFERWRKVAAEKYPNGLPKPFTDDTTQWIFHGHPCASVYWDEGAKRLATANSRMDATVMQVAVARLMGYRWPSELDKEMKLADEMREVMKRNTELDDLVDDDGIVCIPSLNRELPAAERVLAMLERAYGDDWTSETLGSLMTLCGCEGMTLERWLRDKFFILHAKLFGNRPFIWQIWDGLRDGFSVLVNYHKFDRKGLESLIYTYLGDWIEQQKRELAAGTEGAEEKLDAALSLKTKLEKILEGEKPFDIFVRWKKLCDQPLGWDPDINDGVRLNIRPFCEAGVLRENARKLNIKWDKDRGKDVDSAPWAKQFNNERINDHHLSLAEKKAARGVE